MAIQQRRKGASLTGPIYINRSRSPHRDEDVPHVTALSPITFAGHLATKNSTRNNLHLNGITIAECNLLQPPLDGSLVGISVCLDTKLSTGSGQWTITPRINGVSQTGTLRKTIATGEARTVYGAQTDLTSYTYSAGDTIGVWAYANNHTIVATHIAVTLWTT